MDKLKRLDRIKLLENKNRILNEENERLHGVIQELTRELDEAEQNAFAMQEKLSSLMEKVRF